MSTVRHTIYLEDIDFILQDGVLTVTDGETEFEFHGRSISRLLSFLDSFYLGEEFD